MQYWSHFLRLSSDSSSSSLQSSELPILRQDFAALHKAVVKLQSQPSRKGNSKGSKGHVAPLAIHHTQVVAARVKGKGKGTKAKADKGKGNDKNNNTINEKFDELTKSGGTVRFHRTTTTHQGFAFHSRGRSVSTSNIDACVGCNTANRAYTDCLCFRS